MEAHDFFADHVHIGGPVLVEFGGVVGAIAERGNVVRERVEPDVDYVLGIVRHRDAPGERRAADGKIAQSAADEREHFIAPRLGADEMGLLGVEADQLVLKCRELEKIIFFLHRFRGATALRAGRTRTDGIDVEFVKHAILAGVVALIDVAVILYAFPQSLHALLVPVRRGADVIIVGQAHAIPERTEFRRDFIGELLRSLARGMGCTLDLLTVFVGAGQEPGVIAQHAVAARDRVAGKGGIGVSDVGTRIDVVDRSRDVKLFGH